MFVFGTVQLTYCRGLSLPIVDVTVKSGIKAFAPTWDIVMGVKQGKITQQQYTERYLNLMRRSYKANPVEWSMLVESTIPFLIGCYCNPDDFCHRFILADILQKLGGSYRGEITKDQLQSWIV